jgi:hypothetical protein
MVDQADAALLRRWAMQCFAQANDPRTSGEEREQLLKMRVALLEMADTQDWLDGHPQPSPPQAGQPAQQQQQIQATG